MLRRRVAIALMCGALVLVLAGCASLGNLFIPEVVYGSGTVVERSFDASGFNKLYIASRFTGEVQYGEAFSVVVRADDNIIDDVQIAVENGQLNVLMERKNYQNVTEQHVMITMPALEEIALDAASEVTLAGFPHASALTVRVQGASELTGEVHADALDLTLAGTSRATLAGAAETLNVTANSLSVADLAELPVATADVTLSNASRADVTTSQSIVVEASNNSQLVYGGGAAISSNLDSTSTAMPR